MKFENFENFEKTGKSEKKRAVSGVHQRRRC